MNPLPFPRGFINRHEQFVGGVSLMTTGTVFSTFLNSLNHVSHGGTF